MKHDRGGTRVLLAEDSPYARREIKRNLQAVEGVADVVAVGSVSEARKALEDDGFAVCVLDFYLGDGTALDVLRDRSILNRRPRTTFIVFTAAPSPTLRRRCLASGADHFLVKPDDMNELQELLGRLANREGPSSSRA